MAGGKGEYRFIVEKERRGDRAVVSVSVCIYLYGEERRDILVVNVGNIWEEGIEGEKKGRLDVVACQARVGGGAFSGRKEDMLGRSRPTVAWTDALLLCGSVDITLQPNRRATSCCWDRRTFVIFN